MHAKMVDLRSSVLQASLLLRRHFQHARADFPLHLHICLDSLSSMLAIFQDGFRMKYRMHLLVGAFWTLY
jgi:hypothetical protein